MLVLISMSAAIVSTILWYSNPKREQLKLGTLSLMYWGASLMWFVDAVFEYLKEGAAYFQPTAKALLNDAFLGCSVVVFGMLIWLVILLLKDPKGVIRNAAYQNKNS